MERLAPLPVVVPLALAAASIAGRKLPRWVLDLAGVLGSLGVAVVCALLAHRAVQQPFVHWFGGWMPTREQPVGIAFVVQPYGAAFAGFASLMVSAAFLYAWYFLREARGLLHALLFTFLAGLNGFCLTGDLFNLFVWVEVMGVSAYALTAFKKESSAPIQGAFNFAVSNAFGSLLMLLAIGMIYGRTGTLNMAKAGELLATYGRDGLVLVAFALFVTSLFVKAAQVPFHFWFPDAHAVAPAPVNVIAAGAMVMLGYFGLAALYWTVFRGVLAGHEDLLRRILLVFAGVTCVGAGVMTLLQDELKRLLAFSTISHGGAVLAGIASFESDGLAGAAVYVLGHGLLIGTLFMCVGVVHATLGSTYLLRIHGAGRRLTHAATLYLLAALGLAGAPPFAVFIGKSFVEEGLKKAGYGGTKWLLLLGLVLSSAAVLVAGLRVFFGWGARGEEEPEEGQSDDEASTRPHRLLLVPALLLLLIAAAVPFVPRLTGFLEAGAEWMKAHDATANLVLRGTPHALVQPRVLHVKGTAWTSGLLTALAAVGVALAWSARDRLPRGLRKTADVLVRPARLMQSGAVTDYVLWISAGAALLAGAFAVWLR